MFQKTAENTLQNWNSPQNCDVYTSRSFQYIQPKTILIESKWTQHIFIIDLSILAMDEYDAIHSSDVQSHLNTFKHLFQLWYKYIFWIVIFTWMILEWILIYAVRNVLLWVHSNYFIFCCCCCCCCFLTFW